MFHIFFKKIKINFITNSKEKLLSWSQVTISSFTFFFPRHFLLFDQFIYEFSRFKFIVLF